MTALRGCFCFGCSLRWAGVDNIGAGADAGAFVRWSAQTLSLSAILERSVGGNVTSTTLRLNVVFLLGINRSNSLRFNALFGWADTEVMQGLASMASPFRKPPHLACRSEPLHRASAAAALVPSGPTTSRLSASPLCAWSYRVLGSEADNGSMVLRCNVGLLNAGLSHRF